jgi:hypothetical protein
MSDVKVIELIHTHIRRYDAIDIMDIYKLLHQAVFGPGHAIKNQKAAREWLDRESEIHQPNAGETLIENIHPHGMVVRLHLRPYLAANGNLKKLLDAFIQSSKDINGETSLMAQWWQVFYDMVQNGDPLVSRFDKRTMSLVARTRTAENWPASHHSPSYDRAYKPSYRVLTASLAEELLKQQKIGYKII